jgi:hypothetical protein
MDSRLIVCLSVRDFQTESRATRSDRFCFSARDCAHEIDYFSLSGVCFSVAICGVEFAFGSRDRFLTGRDSLILCCPFKFRCCDSSLSSLSDSVHSMLSESAARLFVAVGS